MSSYALGKKAFGFCDRCGFRYPLVDLRTETVNAFRIDIKVCEECWDADPPQNRLGSQNFSDPQALFDPRPDTALYDSRYGDTIYWDFAFGADGWVPSRRGLVSYVSETQLTSSGDVSTFNWSPDGNTIIFNKVDGGTFYTVPSLGGDVTELVTPGVGDSVSYPSYSPDGTKIAFSSGPVGEGDGNQIYTMNSDGSGVSSALTAAAKASLMPVWSPDGSKIVFFREETGSGYVSDIYRIDSDGSNEVRLTSYADENYYQSYAPSSPYKIIFSGVGSGGNWSIWQMSDSGANVTSVAESLSSRGLKYWPNYSPDGYKFQFFGPTQEGTGSNYWEIQTADWDGSNVSEYTPGDGNNPTKRYDGFWAPNGNRIGYVKISDDIYDVYSSAYTVSYSGSESSNLSFNKLDGNVSFSGIYNERRPGIMISGLATDSSDVSIDATKYNYIRMAIRKDSTWLSSAGGSSGWSGRLFWNNSGEDFTYGKSLSVSEPSWSGGYSVLTWNVGGESDWTGIVDKLRIELHNIDLHENWIWLGSYTIDYIRAEVT